MDIRSIIREEVESAMSYRWLEFKLKGDTGKTKIYDVIAKQGSILLGEVKWMARWRKYGFYPQAGTVFEQDCLTDISSFLDRLKQERNNRSSSVV